MARRNDGNTRRPEDFARTSTRGAAAPPNLDPLFEASNKLLEGWMAMGSEMLEFSRNRFDQGVEMSRAMAKSTSLNEAIDLQTRFTRTIVQDCFTEANKMVDLGTRSLLDSLSSLRREEAEAEPRRDEAAA